MKTVETRSKPAPKRLIGQRFGIHAAKAMPFRRYEQVDIGDWHLRMGAGGEPWMVGPDALVRVRSDQAATIDLPLGAIVATAVLSDCVLMQRGLPESLLAPPMAKPIVLVHRDPSGCEEVNSWDGHRWQSLTGQLPYGDFASGRWAWMLSEVEPVERRCPACWGSEDLVVDSCGQPVPCLVCEGDGCCPPVPARGSQRYGWEWTPDSTPSALGAEERGARHLDGTRSGKDPT